MKRLTQKQYARRIKKTPQYVNKLVRQGKIALGRDGKIDTAKADRARAQSRERARAAGGGRPKKGSNAHGGGRPPRIPREPAAAPAAALGRSNATQSLTQARAADAAYQAKLRKLDYEKAVGELLPAGEVREAERRKNANIRTRFRRLPRALAARLAYATRTPAEIERLVLEAIDHELAELAVDPLGLHETPPAPAAVEPEPAVQTIAGGAA